MERKSLGNSTTRIRVLNIYLSATEQGENQLHLFYIFIYLFLYWGKVLGTVGNWDLVVWLGGRGSTTMCTVRVAKSTVARRVLKYSRTYTLNERSEDGGKESWLAQRERLVL